MKMRATRAHTARAMSLFAFLVLSTTGAWSAAGVDPDESTEYLVHAMGNVEQLEAVFQGIVHIIDSPAFKTAVLLTMTIALVMQGFAGQFTNSKLTLADLIGDRVKNLIVPMVLTTALFAGPRATVTIVDPYWGHSSGMLVQIVAPRKVDNVPIGFAMFANFFSVTRTHLQAAFDEAFAQPDDLRYSKTGMLFGNKVMTNLASIQVSNPNLRADLIAYMRNCYFYDVYQGRVQPEAVLAPDIWKGMTNGVNIEVTASGRKTFTYGPNVVTNPNRLTQVIYDKQHPRPSGAPVTETYETMGCLDAVSVITRKMASFAIYEEENWVRRLMRGTITSGTTDSGKAAFATAVGGILPNFMGSNSNYAVADHIRQAAMTNLVKESGGDLGTILANPAIVQQATAQAQSEVAVKANYVQTARLAEMALPLIRNGLEAIAYGCFPIVILVALAYGANGAMPVLKGYLIGLGTLQIWGPLYSIVNMLGTDFSKRKLFNMLGGQPSFTLENMSMISNEMSSDMAVMGYMVLLVPVIAGMLVKAGMDGVSGMASQMMSPATGTAASGMAQNAALGNYSWDNLTQGNTTAHNFSGFNTNFNNTLANKYNPETVLAGSSKDLLLQDNSGITTFRGKTVAHKADFNSGPQDLTITSADAIQASKAVNKAHKLVDQTAVTQSEAYVVQSKAANEWLSTIGNAIQAAQDTWGEKWADNVYVFDKNGERKTLGSQEWFRANQDQFKSTQTLKGGNAAIGTDKDKSPTAPEDIKQQNAFLLMDMMSKAAGVTVSPLFQNVTHTSTGINRATTLTTIGGAGGAYVAGSKPVWDRYKLDFQLGDNSDFTNVSGSNLKRTSTGSEATTGIVRESATERDRQKDNFSRINSDLANKRAAFIQASEKVEKAEFNHQNAIVAERGVVQTHQKLEQLTAAGTYKPLTNPQETSDLALTNAYRKTHEGKGEASMEQMRDWLSQNKDGLAQSMFAQEQNAFHAASPQEKIDQMREFLLKSKKNEQLLQIENADHQISKDMKYLLDPQHREILRNDFENNPLVSEVNNNLNAGKILQENVENRVFEAKAVIEAARINAEAREQKIHNNFDRVKVQAVNQVQVGKAEANDIPRNGNIGTDPSSLNIEVGKYIGGAPPSSALNSAEKFYNDRKYQERRNEAEVEIKNLESNYKIDINPNSFGPSPLTGTPTITRSEKKSGEEKIIDNERAEDLRSWINDSEIFHSLNQPVPSFEEWKKNRGTKSFVNGTEGKN